VECIIETCSSFPQLLGSPEWGGRLEWVRAVREMEREATFERAG
jgi:hypothetical protein